LSIAQYQAEPILSVRHDLGEGIRWDGDRDEIYWTDVFTGTFFRAAENGHGLTEPQATQLTPPLTALSPIAGRRGWVAALCQGIAFVPAPGTVVVAGMPEAASLGSVRMNDGACDPAGRFWAGSMSYRSEPGAGSLYCLDLDGQVRRVLGGLTISNGLGWSPDGRVMYHADSGPGTLSRMDFDVDSGAVRNRTTILKLPPDDGVPDGLCVDAEGCLWVAIWGGHQVRRYDPDGRLLAVVNVPARQVSCCALSASGTLFVTTARNGLPPHELEHDKAAGRLFAAAVGVPGRPADPYRGAVGEPTWSKEDLNRHG